MVKSLRFMPLNLLNKAHNHRFIHADNMLQISLDIKSIGYYSMLYSKYNIEI